MTHDAKPGGTRRTIRRHALATRIWHWVNAATVVIMIGSGLMILNAHPHLYWGEYGANYDQPWIDLPHWPGWLTIPSTYNLALARRWHLTFALVLGFALLAFMVVSLVNRHFARDLRVRRREVAPRRLWADVKAHLAFRFSDPERPGRYNILQKLSYVAVIFVLLPLLIGTGLTMSPGIDAAWPWLLDLFGGRQSARSIHFVCAALLTVFVVVHLALVILAGVWNEVRSMITGRWTIEEERA
ncbi:cytochrome b/b6 domain-containing protein [Stakelama saccharophila]|uniref:Cytochrome b/b6 domain-containing protein n=1 Tax=Stakelama saccharophila TaxID=3075605 RepID=A0ABZ0BBZ1_9SPHN|nr:cytochrome b/b6 domain-containing protein [Stakelama sp. W311]WNO54176.1 cytochrome b/b6 domain-containing protein [Stakelama sp. W311]